MQRISFPFVEGQAAPESLLASLREIDPTIELVHFGGGDWRLGSVLLTEERESKGRMILDQQNRLDVKYKKPKNYLLGLLAVQGFAQIERYIATQGVEGTVYVPGADDYDKGYFCTVLEDFRERDNAWERDRGEANFRSRMAITSGVHKQEESDARLRDYVHTDGRDHYRREVRNRKMFGYAGETGGGGHIILPFGG